MEGVVVNAVVGEVAEPLLTRARQELVVDPFVTWVKKEIGYVWNYEENVEKLRNEVERLNNMKERVEQKIRLALDNGDGLLAGVEMWVNEALVHISTTEDFFRDEDIANKTCFYCLPMCVTLRRYGKKATDKVSSLKQHQIDGATYEGNVSIPTPSPGIVELLPRGNFDELGTHNSTLEQIIESVKSESSQITGIYGMGGVGKTTLATEVAARVKDLFALVVFVTVSLPVDVASIRTQVEIAAKRINKGEKVLIILDDVWNPLNLHTLGIPSGARFPSCTILLTSREISVCRDMNAHLIGVDPLPDQEAWILFKRVCGERVETDELYQVAMKVVEGCGGLPLILQAVGKALKDEENFIEWERALYNIEQLQTSDIAPSIRSEFAHLKLSYDYLKSREAKSIFLLCSMFPKDESIPLESLAYYCVGLEIFEDLRSLEAARNKVQGEVKILKSSCLLLDGKYESTTKMHDVIREVALLIASKDDNKYFVEAGKNLTEWIPNNGDLERHTGISLMRNDIRKLPDYELNIPLLKIFLIQANHSLSEISDEFTQATKEAKVIDFMYNNIISLPKSLNQLARLRMLNLRGNKRLCDVSILGELKDLEILILSNTGITEIPEGIGKLTNLRLFDVASCLSLSHIARDVLSKLRSLEELRIGYYPAPVEEGKYNSLVEIGKLLKLTFLHLSIPRICFFPEVDYPKKLKRFSIQIGVKEDIVNSITVNRTLILDTLCLDISHLKLVRKWIDACIGICLLSIEKLDNIMPRICCEGSGLKEIIIKRCSDLLCLVDSEVLVKRNTSFLSEVEELWLTGLSSLKVIWNCPDRYISLKNLVRCEIGVCPNLEKLFTVSIAQGLVKLKKLQIIMCDSLKDVISDRDGETSTGKIDTVVQAKNMVFPCLAEIYLHRMLHLTSFYPGNATIEYPSLVSVWISDVGDIGYKNRNNEHQWIGLISERRVITFRSNQFGGSTKLFNRIQFREREFSVCVYLRFNEPFSLHNDNDQTNRIYKHDTG